MAEFPELVQVPPVSIVTRPVKVLVPVEEVIFKTPLAPCPTVVVPVTVRSKAPTLKVVPSSTNKFPPIMTFPAVALAPKLEVVR